MTTLQFEEFGKIPRLFRNTVITEKIDGTNACVVVSDDGLEIGAQSRNRLISPGNDNYGFAAWVQEHKDILLRLGPGHHFGEWWGKGIGRNYGLETRKFSLFNVHRWSDFAKWDKAQEAGISVVPVLKQHTFDTDAVKEAIEDLRKNGSKAAPGFMNPEGIIVFHHSSNQLFKATLDKDDEWKGKITTNA